LLSKDWIADRGLRKERDSENAAGEIPLGHSLPITPGDRNEIWRKEGEISKRLLKRASLFSEVSNSIHTNKQDSLCIKEKASDQESCSRGSTLGREGRQQGKGEPQGARPRRDPPVEASPGSSVKGRKRAGKYQEEDVFSRRRSRGLTQTVRGEKKTVQRWGNGFGERRPQETMGLRPCRRTSEEGRKGRSGRMA